MSVEQALHPSHEEQKKRRGPLRLGQQTKSYFTAPLSDLSFEVFLQQQTWMSY